MKISLRAKIIGSFLTICVTSLVIIGGVCVFELKQISRAVERYGEKTGAVISEWREKSLKQILVNNLRAVASEKAALVDQVLWIYVDELLIMKAYAEKIYNNAENFRPRPLLSYSSAPRGEPALYRFGKTPESAALVHESGMLGNIYETLDAIVKRYPELSTIRIYTESGLCLQFDGGDYDRALLRPGAGDAAAPRRSDWYAAAKELKGLYISDAYVDSEGRGRIVTMSAPIYAGFDRFIGVVSLDIHTAEIEKAVRDANVSGGRVDLIGVGGVTVASTGINAENETSPPDYWNNIRDGAIGDGKTAANGETLFIAWDTAPIANWRVVYIISEAEVTAPIEQMRTEIIDISREIDKDTDKKVSAAALTVAALVAAVIAAASAAGVYVTWKISRPVRRLAADAEIIGAGNLDHSLTADTGDEIEILANAINTMLADIKMFIKENERRGAELRIAATIQESMMPAAAARPGGGSAELYASMLPAKDVGGDFYDFFFTDDGETLVAVVADVSGKGVPAALFMVVVKTLIKTEAKSCKTPKETMETVNAALCEGNAAKMFATAFVAFLNVKTGELTYANAGHNPPLLTRGGAFEPLKARPGFVLAGRRETVYSEASVRMNPGDTLFMYTDGVTEAENSDLKFWGVKRFIQSADKNIKLPPNELAAAVQRDMDAFTAGVEQSDDVTMFILRYNGAPRAARRLTVEADTGNLPAVQSFIETALAESGFAPKSIKQTMIAAEEIFVNTALYSGSAQAEVMYEFAGGAASVTFADSGAPFNPLELTRSEPLTRPVTSRSPGGFGVMMARRLTDGMTYSRCGGKNILTMIKRL